jgi:polyribonucleotide nucleotidyltransferase
MFVRESVMVGGRALTLETGRLAKQAHGSILVTYGDTMVLVTVVSHRRAPRPRLLPAHLRVRREDLRGRQDPRGLLQARGPPARRGDPHLPHHGPPAAPALPGRLPQGHADHRDGALSSDKQNKADVLALTGASAALHISDIPWAGPIVGVRVGRKDGELVAYPTVADLETCDIDLVVACSRDAIVMVEGGAAEATENDLIDALMFAHETAQPVIDLIEKMRAAVGKPKREFKAAELDPTIKARVAALVDEDLKKATKVTDKKARYEGYSVLKKKLGETLLAELGAEKYLGSEKLIKAEFEERKAHVVRSYVLDEGKRIDGRDTRTIRPILCEAGLLPRVHGSALFQRGETQAIVTTTLGTSTDEQKIDGLMGETWKRFYLHYNFPPFSTGETKPMRGPGRREIGHGALAERALARMIPPPTFPYTIRIVSETLESNGSSSMAAVCGGCLSLMDAGVPIKAPVAGIAMGLIMEGRQATRSSPTSSATRITSATWTSRSAAPPTASRRSRWTSRSPASPAQILQQALDQAREGRLHILGKMLETLPTVRAGPQQYAPRITTVKVKPDQIRLIIGPGGKTIKGIVDQTGVAIDVEDDGTVNVASSDSGGREEGPRHHQGAHGRAEIGATYTGAVKRVADFGAFVEILPNIDGLLHISEMAHTPRRARRGRAQRGRRVDVKVLSVDREGKIRLTRRELLPLPEGEEGERAAERMAQARDAGPPPRRDGPRGGGDRGGPRGGGDRGGPRGGGDRGGPPRRDRR